MARDSLKIKTARAALRALIAEAETTGQWLVYDDLFKPGSLDPWMAPKDVLTAIADESGTDSADHPALWVTWRLGCPLNEYKRLQREVNDAIKRAETFRFKLLKAGITNV